MGMDTSSGEINVPYRPESTAHHVAMPDVARITGTPVQERVGALATQDATPIIAANKDPSFAPSPPPDSESHQPSPQEGEVPPDANPPADDGGPPDDPPPPNFNSAADGEDEPYRIEVVITGENETLVNREHLDQQAVGVALETMNSGFDPTSWTDVTPEEPAYPNRKYYVRRDETTGVRLFAKHTTPPTLPVELDISEPPPGVGRHQMERGKDLRQLFASDAAQEAAQAHGFASIDIVEPLTATTDESGAETIVYPYQEGHTVEDPSVEHQDDVYQPPVDSELDRVDQVIADLEDRVEPRFAEIGLNDLSPSQIIISTDTEGNEHLHVTDFADLTSGMSDSPDQPAEGNPPTELGEQVRDPLIEAAVNAMATHPLRAVILAHLARVGDRLSIAQIMTGLNLLQHADEPGWDLGGGADAAAVGNHLRALSEERLVNLGLRGPSVTVAQANPEMAEAAEAVAATIMRWGMDYPTVPQRAVFGPVYRREPSAAERGVPSLRLAVVEHVLQHGGSPFEVADSLQEDRGRVTAAIRNLVDSGILESTSNTAPENQSVRIEQPINTKPRRDASPLTRRLWEAVKDLRQQGYTRMTGREFLDALDPAIDRTAAWTAVVRTSSKGITIGGLSLEPTDRRERARVVLRVNPQYIAPLRALIGRLNLLRGADTTTLRKAGEGLRLILRNPYVMSEYMRRTKDNLEGLEPGIE